MEDSFKRNSAQTKYSDVRYRVGLWEDRPNVGPYTFSVNMVNF